MTTHAITQGALLPLKTQVMADMQAFGVFVEGVRSWGRAEREGLGL